jgi:hypothetical protein
MGRRTVTVNTRISEWVDVDVDLADIDLDKLRAELAEREGRPIAEFVDGVGLQAERADLQHARQHYLLGNFEAFAQAVYPLLRDALGVAI